MVFMSFERRIEVSRLKKMVEMNITIWLKLRINVILQTIKLKTRNFDNLTINIFLLYFPLNAPCSGNGWNINLRKEN